MAIELHRTFWPVGHGAFYTEQFVEEGNVVFTAVYDCGSEQEEALYNCVDAFKGNIKSINQIDVLFISHFHADHVNGLVELLHGTKVKNLVIPQLTDGYVLECLCSNGTTQMGIEANNFVWKLYKGEDRDIAEKVYEVAELAAEERGDERFAEPIEGARGHKFIKGRLNATLFGFNKNYLWEYIPYNSELSKSQALVEAFKLNGFTSVGGSLDINRVYGELQNQEGWETIQNIYGSVYTSGHNKYSMPVFSGLMNNANSKTNLIERGCLWPWLISNRGPQNEWINCLYTGDFEPGKKKMSNLVKYLDEIDMAWDRTYTLQIPHHGSKNNISPRLYKNGMIGIISAAVGDKHHHPNVQTIQEAWRNGTFVWVVTDFAITGFTQWFEIV